MEDASVDGQPGAWRDDVDVVGLGSQASLASTTGHGRVPEPATRPSMLGWWVEVLYHTKEQSACHRDVLQELLQRLEPAAEAPRPDDQRAPGLPPVFLLAQNLWRARGLMITPQAGVSTNWRDDRDHCDTPQESPAISTGRQWRGRAPKP